MTSALCSSASWRRRAKTRLWTRRVALFLFGLQPCKQHQSRPNIAIFRFPWRIALLAFLSSMSCRFVDPAVLFCLLIVGEHSILSFWRDDVNYIPKHLNFGPDVTILYNGIWAVTFLMQLQVTILLTSLLPSSGSCLNIYFDLRYAFGVITPDGIE